MKLFRMIEDNYITYQITPDTSVRNHHTEHFIKIIANYWKTPAQRQIWFDNQLYLTPKFWKIPINFVKWLKNGHYLLQVYEFDRVAFRILYQYKRITFYITLPADKQNELLRKLEAVWPKATILPIKEPLPILEANKTVGAYLHYRKPDLFSLKVNHTDNEPLHSLMPTIRDLEEGDIALFDTLFLPYSYHQWEHDAQKDYSKMEKGQIVTRPGQQAGLFLFNIFNMIMNEIRYGLLDIATISKEDKQKLEKLKRAEVNKSQSVRILKDLTSLSTKKRNDSVMQVSCRIAAQSDDPQRANRIVRTIANAWKDISEDNELDRTDIPAKKIQQFLVDIDNRKPIKVRMYSNLMSVPESSKFIQVPGDELQREFPEIENIKVKEISVPEELCQEVGIRYGLVTEKGITKLIRQPIHPYDGIPLKFVYDSLCLAAFAQGGQSTGKTGMGRVWCYDFICNGFTTIIIDTADGQMIREIEDSLPEDYPEEKMIHINCDNKSWPVATNWSDVLGRKFKSVDNELQAEEVSERITSRFIEFIEGMATSEFSDGMKQYLTSIMKAVTTLENWSFQDIELCLTSPTFREELLQLPAIQAMPEVVDDLVSLQGIADRGTNNTTVNGILSRIRMLSNSKFLGHMFYQSPKLDEQGKPLLDFRKFMDNEPTGDPNFDKYGYCVTIQASYDSWQDYQSLILAFFEDKINFNVFSRIELPQDERKPVLKWIDEPHKVIKSVARYYKGSNVEFRKYRCKNLYTLHSIDQMGDAADSLMDGGANIISYKTKRLSQFERFIHAFEPFEDAEELYSSLADKREAVISLSLPSNKPCPAFIAKMSAPPEKVKDRSARRQECAEIFGRPWKEVAKTIQERKRKYQKLDAAREEETKGKRK